MVKSSSLAPVVADRGAGGGDDGEGGDLAWLRVFAKTCVGG